MRHNLIFGLLVLAFQALGQGSSNMTLFSNLEIPNLPIRYGAYYNDVWGYAHANGTEVAIVGGIEDIFFVDVTNPADPEIIYTHHVENTGTNNTNQSLWRDFKTYGNYAYACSDEGSAGLLIFDLSNVPTSVTLVNQTNDFFARAHNIYIDELNGRLYGAGTNTTSNGLVILNLTDPENPSLRSNLALNTYGGGYVHDVYVRDDTAYCSHGSLAKLQMYDLHNINDVQVVGTVENYPEPGYNHSSWVSDDGHWLVMADETHGSDLKLVNITDPLNISSDDIYTFYSELLGANAPGSSIVHNPFILGDQVYLSYYHDGVQVFDISNPNNITNIAYYDTYPDNTNYFDYDGCWGVYPYLPSGHIIATDMTYGLHVMEVITFPLPIDFVSFRARREGEDVRLDWTVANAADGEWFDVMRSTDGGLTFESVGRVALASGSLDYQYTDTRVDPFSQYVYRIDFIEFTGTRIASPLRSVTTAPGENTVRLVNPVRDELGLVLQAPMDQLDVQWFDVTGKWLGSRHIDSPGAKVRIPMPDVPAGQYLVHLAWPGGSMQSLIQKL